MKTLQEAMGLANCYWWKPNSKRSVRDLVINKLLVWPVTLD
jgi:hypothetical protein